ncbi:multiprotein-bridging factor 1 family protein [Kitasatospora sp. NBC_01560]|uniref:helix-turn-helix domain-containing protein n=1 Tax=Kitasatospora sp. NBC_01560 TaxID=2975965 RepID=UPI00386CBA89
MHAEVRAGPARVLDGEEAGLGEPPEVLGLGGPRATARQLDPTAGPWAPFGVQLRRSREARGLTQAQLARKVGYDPSYVSYAELATREPPSEKFASRVDEALETGGTLLLMWLQNKHSALLEGFPETRVTRPGPPRYGSTNPESCRGCSRPRRTQLRWPWPTFAAGPSRGGRPRSE